MSDLLEHAKEITDKAMGEWVGGSAGDLRFVARKLITEVERQKEELASKDALIVRLGDAYVQEVAREMGRDHLNGVWPFDYETRIEQARVALAKITEGRG